MTKGKRVTTSQIRLYFKSNFVISRAIGTAITTQVDVTENARIIDLQKIIRVFSLKSHNQESAPALRALKIRYTRGSMHEMVTSKQGISKPIGILKTPRYILLGLVTTILFNKMVRRISDGAPEFSSSC